MYPKVQFEVGVSAFAISPIRPRQMDEFLDPFGLFCQTNLLRMFGGIKGGSHGEQDETFRADSGRYQSSC